MEIEDRYLEYAGSDVAGESAPLQPKPSSAPKLPKLTGRKGLTYAIRTTLTWAG